MPGVTTATKTQPANWFWFAAGKSGVQFTWAFTQGSQFSVQVYIDTGDLARNQEIFDALEAQVDALASEIEAPLKWERLAGRRGKRIAAYAPYVVTIDSPGDELKLLREWAIVTMVEFVGAFRPRLRSMP